MWTCPGASKLVSPWLSDGLSAWRVDISRPPPTLLGRTTSPSLSTSGAVDVFLMTLVLRCSCGTRRLPVSRPPGRTQRLLVVCSAFGSVNSSMCEVGAERTDRQQVACDVYSLRG